MCEGIVNTVENGQVINILKLHKKHLFCYQLSTNIISTYFPQKM